MKFQVNIQGQDFEVEAPNAEALPEIVETISREQRATQRPEVTSPGITPQKFTGEIRKPPTFREKVKGALPAFGQFTGGILGGVGGATVGKPAVGGAVGGTVGRGVGRLAQKQMEQFEREPLKTIGRQAVFGPIAGTLAKTSESERKQIGKEVLKTAAIEGVLGVAGAGLTKLASNIGSSISGALIGDRTTKRGIERGFDKILDPRNFEGRLEKSIAERGDRFFQRLTNVAGKKVSSAVKKFSSIFHNTDDMVVKGKQLLSDSKAISIDDFKTSNVSNSQLNKAKEIQKIFDSVGSEDRIGTFDLWNKRKEMDKIFYNTRWDGELGGYLSKLRRITNTPITETSDEVAEAFGRYSFVKDAEDEVGKKFTAIKRPGEIFAPKIEQFAGQTLSTSKDEQIRLLKALDDILPKSDKVIEDLLDAAASEVIDKPFGGGLFKTGLQMLGGKKRIAQFGRFFQRPTTKAIKSGIGRGVVTSATELLQDKE